MDCCCGTEGGVLSRLRRTVPFPVGNELWEKISILCWINLIRGSNQKPLIRNPDYWSNGSDASGTTLYFNFVQKMCQFIGKMISGKSNLP